MDNSVLWYLLDVNPEPWAVGPLGVSRKNGSLRPFMGRNQQLDAYQNAVKELLEAQKAVVVPPFYDLHFYFWRNQADYEGDNKTVRKNQVDATNMQKATEDALQGVLIGNDRDVRVVGSTIVAQGPSVRGAVAIRLRWGLPPLQDTGGIPAWMLAEVDQMAFERPKNDNVWPPRD